MSTLRINYSKELFKNQDKKSKPILTLKHMKNAPTLMMTEEAARFTLEELQQAKSDMEIESFLDSSLSTST